MVQVLKQCGDDLSRENVMRQATALTNHEPFVLLPGIKINTGPGDYRARDLYLKIDEPSPKYLSVVVIVVRSWPRPIVPIIRRRLVVSTSGRVGALLFKHRAASSAKLWSVSLQAGHNPVHIGDLRAAEPPNVGRASHLLFHRSPILLRKCRILNNDATADR
jgi:hypothetical protein